MSNRNNWRQVAPKLRLLGDRILAVPYEKPEQVGSIVLPEAHRLDKTWTLWEVVDATEAAEEAVGCRLNEGDIIETMRRIPVDTGLRTKEGRTLHILGAKSSEVIAVTPKTW